MIVKKFIGVTLNLQFIIVKNVIMINALIVAFNINKNDLYQSNIKYLNISLSLPDIFCLI